jgi:Arc/MetJ family transcription regulator
MTMRTTIVIDDKLMADAFKATGARSKRELVEMGLRALVQLKQQERIRGFRGKLTWSGDLERMRTD